MSQRRRPPAPRTLWSAEELERDRTVAIALFRRARMEEPLHAYLDAFARAEQTLRELFELSADLSLLEAEAAAILASPRLLEGLRYLPGPPISTDDLKTLVDARSLAAAALRNQPELQARLLETIRSGLDSRRFPWVGQNRAPSAAEREAALIATATLIATQQVATQRRTEGKLAQEEDVRQALLAHGMDRPDINPSLTPALYYAHRFKEVFPATSPCGSAAHGRDVMAIGYRLKRFAPAALSAKALRAVPSVPGYRRGIGAARALLAIGVLLAACAPAEQRPPVLSATAEGDGNSLEVAVDGLAATIDVWSNRGIGGATVELLDGPAPTAVALRLHLRGMEELRIVDAAGTTVVSVSSGPGHTVSQRRIGPDGVERDVAPGAPGHLEVAIVADGADPPFPLTDGHFSVTLPPGILTEGERAFTLRWVDFFR